MGDRGTPGSIRNVGALTNSGRDRSHWVEEELTFVGVCDGEAARLHIRTNRRTVMMPTVLRIVMDTVISGSAAKG